MDWLKGEPDKSGYYLATWIRDGAIKQGVIAWMSMLDPPKD